MSYRIDLAPKELSAIMKDIRERGREIHGAAGQFGALRLSPEGTPKADHVQMSSPQYDLLAVWLILGIEMATSVEEGFNAVDRADTGQPNWERVALSLQAASDFFYHLPGMYRAGDSPEDGSLPKHLGEVGHKTGTRDSRIAGIAKPLGQVLSKDLFLSEQNRTLLAKLAAIKSAAD